MTETPISIGKRWPNSRVPWHMRGSRGGKPTPTLYFLNESGKLRTKPINKIKELTTKPRIKKRRLFVCLVCGRKFVALVKNDKDLVECIYGCQVD
jgi:hypothetical protein